MERYCLRRPRRQCAGLIEYNRLDLRHALDHQGVLEEDLYPREHPLHRAQRERRR
jgi:hypothetical protein